jgi:hypothetical protein
MLVIATVVLACCYGLVIGNGAGKCRICCPVADSYERDNEILRSVKGAEFLFIFVCS